MSTIFGAVLVVLLGITCGHATAYIDERDMKGETIFGFVSHPSLITMIVHHVCVADDDCWSQ